MRKCMKCKENIDESAGVFWVVNEEMSDEFLECWTCHDYRMNNGSTTQCECCGNYFTPDHLEINPETGEKELCPYCHKIWCE